MTQFTIILLLVISIFCDISTVQAEQLYAGIATIDITPPIPFRMCGSFSEELSTGIKDPLLAKATVLEQGDRRAALVFCAIAQISLDLSTRARLQTANQTGIPAANIAIAATHSHTGSLYFGALRKHFHNRTTKRYHTDIYEKVDYVTELLGKLVKVIGQAASSMVPVQLEAGFSYEDRISFNRHFHMKTGPVRFNPGQLNPDIVRPAGPIDPEVGIVLLKAAEGEKPIGAIVSFALHLDTVGGTKYSTDFPKVVQDQLRRTHGPEFISLFGAGTCGDINHVDVKTRDRYTTQEIGTMLTETVVKKMPSLTPLAEVSLAVSSRRVCVPLQTFNSRQITQARERIELVDSDKLPFLERVEAYKILAIELRDGEILPIEVQVFRLNSDVAIVTLPGEVFVELGLAIKQASPFKTTLVIELTNDGPGYIPTKKAFSEGSYETVNSRVQPGSGEMMVEAAIQLLDKLAVDTE